MRRPVTVLQVQVQVQVQVQMQLPGQALHVRVRAL